MLRGQMRNTVVVLCLSAACLPARAATGWSVFDNKDLAPASGSERCPDGTAHYSNVKDVQSLSIGAQFNIEWGATKTSLTEGEPGKCVSVTTTESTGDTVKRVTVTSRCAKKSLEGTSETTIQRLTETQIAYRRTERDANSKTTKTTSCHLVVQKD